MGHWIADHEGVKACVASAEQADFWIRVQGWTATTEPVGQDRQWIRHAETGGRGVLTHDAAVLHEELGWLPSDPPPVPGLPDPPAAPASASTKTAARAADKKE